MIAATVCQTHEEFTAAPAGAILPVWRGEPADGIITLLMIKCPGCAAVSGLQIRPFDDHRAPSWDMSGFFEAITLAPSVHHKAVCGWHGWLRSGQWKSVNE